MTTIKQLVGHDRAEQLYGLKDELKVERRQHELLDHDPMDMNRTRFERYMAAKAEAIINERINEGAEVEDAFRSAHIYLTMLDSKWRVAATEYNHHKQHDIIDMKEVV